MNTLREAVTEYLAMRRALGFRLHTAGIGLFKFVSYLEEQKADYITTLLAVAWAQEASSAQDRAQRLSYVRVFTRFRSATDPRTEIPASDIFPFRPKRARPYIYSEEDIQKLLNAALTLPLANGFRGHTYCCLLGLLYVSGLRISEAIGLKINDVDLTEGLLRVEGAKLGKSRLAPLHTSTLEVLADYKARREECFGGRCSDYFFLSLRGNRLNKSRVTQTFHLLSRQIGLRDYGSSTGPRLHDFRHTFAIHTMLRWYQCGDDVERRLPVLSTYLGHVRMSDTYWYLTAVPELMGLGVKLLEQRWEVES